MTVTQGRGTTTHEVTVTSEDGVRYAPDSTPERLLEASFESLLEREPASSILSRFALPVVRAERQAERDTCYRGCPSA